MYITYAASHACCRETPSHLLSHCSWTLHNCSHRDPADLDRGVESGVDVYPGVHKLEARFIRLMIWSAGNRISEQCDLASPSIWRLSRSLDITFTRTDNSHDTEIGHGSEITGRSKRDSLNSASAVTGSHACDDSMASQIWDDDGQVRVSRHRQMICHGRLKGPADWTGSSEVAGRQIDARHHRWRVGTGT